MRLERLPLLMWRIKWGLCPGKDKPFIKTFCLRVGWGSRDSTFIWELLWLATIRIPAKEGHKTHMGQPEWQNCKSKAQQVAAMLIPELLWPITVRDVLSSVLPLQETGLAEISQTKVGRKFQKKITPCWKHLPARPFWFKCGSSHLGELPLELCCHSSKTQIPPCHMLYIWDRQGRKGRYLEDSTLVSSEPWPGRAMKAP